MNLEQLTRLAARGESDRLEFKKSTGDLKGGMETLCGFLNGQGGRVLFGVSKSGKITGQDISDATLQEVAQDVRRLEPPADVVQTRVPVQGTREVLVLATSDRSHGPYAYNGRAYRRIGNTTSLMPQAEYERRLLQRGHPLHRWENQIAEGYTVADLDAKAIDSMLDAAVQCGRLERKPARHTEALDKLKLRIDGKLLRAAVVLFAREVLPDYPQCGLRMARFRGNTKLADFIDQRQLHGHAFQLFEEADLFLRRHVPVAGSFRPDNWVRQDQPAYPFMALREALVNAICHRDYSIVGGAIHVAVFDDRLEIISSGSLPVGIAVADLKREHDSVLRNPLIADAFFRCGLIERWGWGTQKIVELCRAAGQPEPEFEERTGSLVVRFLPGEYVAPTRVGHDLSDRQRQVLQFLADGQRRRLQEVHQSLANPPGLRSVQLDLRLLRELGLVATSGRGANARWWLHLDGRGAQPERNPSATRAHSERNHTKRRSSRGLHAQD